MRDWRTIDFFSDADLVEESPRSPPDPGQEGRRRGNHT